MSETSRSKLNSLKKSRVGNLRNNASQVKTMTFLLSIEFIRLSAENLFVKLCSDDSVPPYGELSNPGK